MEESAVSNAFNNLKQQVIEYDGQYNTKFRAISNKPILTVEISPTGSGKSTFYKNSPNTIMLMPSNSMVLQNNGMISLNKVLIEEACLSVNILDIVAKDNAPLS